MKFVKKPVVVEAEQWLATEESLQKIERMLQRRPPANLVEFHRMPGIGSTEVALTIKTLESGDKDYQRPAPGDWIISGVNLEVYACKPDIFLKSYVLEGE